MKKNSWIIVCLFLTGIMGACEKSPDLSQLDDDNLVVTHYDETVDFNSFVSVKYMGCIWMEVIT